MDIVYLDPETKTIQYSQDRENLIPIETDKEPRNMSYNEVIEWIQDLVNKHLTNEKPKTTESQEHPTWKPKYPIAKESGKPAGPPPITTMSVSATIGVFIVSVINPFMAFPPFK